MLLRSRLEDRLEGSFPNDLRFEGLSPTTFVLKAFGGLGYRLQVVLYTISVLIIFEDSWSKFPSPVQHHWSCEERRLHEISAAITNKRTSLNSQSSLTTRLPEWSLSLQPLQSHKSNNSLSEKKCLHLLNSHALLNCKGARWFQRLCEVQKDEATSAAGVSSFLTRLFPNRFDSPDWADKITSLDLSITLFLNSLNFICGMLSQAAKTKYHCGRIYVV